MPAILKKIEFTSFTAQIQMIQPQSRILIRWTLAPSNQQLSRLKFFVDRGESEAELKTISTAIPASGPLEFVDYTASLIDVHKIYHYQIRAVEYDGATPVQTFTTGPFTFDGEQDLVGIYIVEEHEYLHRYVTGVPTLVFRRIRDGIYCPECFDTVLKRVTKSNCTTCYGTGKLGGFYPPLEIWPEIMEAPPVNPKISERGDTQNAKTMIRFTNYPIVLDGDIVVEMQQNRYWKINGITSSEKHRYPVLQLCDVSEVGRNDVEQHIQIDPAVRARLVAELVAQRQEREF